MDPSSSEIVYYDEWDDPVYGHRNVDCDNGEINSTGPIDDIRFVATPANGYAFLDFGMSNFQGIKHPKGLVGDGVNTFTRDYSTWTNNDLMNPMPTNTVSYIDDWDNDLIAWVEQSSPNQFVVKCESQSRADAWIRNLSAQMLQVKFFERVDSFYCLGGVFAGTLQMDGVAATSSAQPSAFVLRYDGDGLVHSMSTVNGLNPTSEVGFSNVNQKVAVSSVVAANSVSINGTTFNTVPGSIVNLLSDHLSTTTLSNSITLSNAITLLKTAHAPKDGLITYLLQGGGTYTTGGQTYHLDGTNDYVLVTVDSSGALLWTNRIPKSEVVGGHLDLTYSSKVLSVGLTFNDSVSIQGHTLVSKGEEDIAIFNFDQSGAIFDIRHYGTTQKEQLNRMTSSQSRVYLGGEFGGSNSYRRIGEHGFMTLSNSAANPFISYIKVEDNASRPELREANLDVNTHLNLSSAAVYPNPFNNKLYLGFVAEQGEVYEAKVYSSSGYLIHRLEISGMVGRNEVELSPNQELPQGIYIITLVSNKGAIKHFKAIKMANK